jgi:hypothetical protein
MNADILRSGIALLAGTMICASPASGAETSPLVLETKIPLGKIIGRIDHFAFDPMRQRLYVAERHRRRESQEGHGYPVEGAS